MKIIAPLIFTLGIAFSRQYETRTIENLIINANPKIAMVVNKDEQEGLKDLKNLASTSEIEEAWCYLPKKKQWIEIGIEETNSSLEANIPLKEDIIQENDDIIFYHLHPKDITSKTDNMQFLRLIIPSEIDLFMAARESANLFKKYKDGTFNFKIVSESGVTEYHMLRKIKNLNPVRRQLINQLNKMENDVFYYSFLFSGRDEISESEKEFVIDYFCNKGTPNLFKVDFKKWEEIEKE